VAALFDRRTVVVLPRRRRPAGTTVRIAAVIGGNRPATPLTGGTRALVAVAAISAPAGSPARRIAAGAVRARSAVTAASARLIGA
jgi:hypothetical protein